MIKFMISGYDIFTCVLLYAVFCIIKFQSIVVDGRRIAADCFNKKTAYCSKLLQNSYKLHNTKYQKPLTTHLN